MSSEFFMEGMAGLATLRHRPTLSSLGVTSVTPHTHFVRIDSILAPSKSQFCFLKIPCFHKGFYESNGGNGGARTRDLGLKRALLYQLSYIPEIRYFSLRGNTDSYKE